MNLPQKSVITALFTAFVACCFEMVEAADRIEMVPNPHLATAQSGILPDHWKPWTPDWKEAACGIRGTPEGIFMDAPGKPFAVGGMEQHIENVKPDQAYAIEATCRLTHIPAPQSTVLVRITWTNNGRQIHPAGMLVRGPFIDGDTAQFKDVLVASAKADGADLSLEIKWPRGGSVLWQNVSMHPTATPEPRKVKVGTVYLRPRSSTPENNLRLFCEQIDAAGKLKLDVVCLGELINVVGTNATIKDTAEPIPGPATKTLGDAAKRNSLWVIATLTELDGQTAYNTAVLLDRKGDLAGKYRKVHLPREEWKKGVTPGDSYPVFETDFGKVAVQICYDWFFPEPEQIFALKGAEIIFAPTWGNTWPDKDGCVNGETVFRVRARDNGVYMVPSVYDGNSLVIDPMGRILANSNGKEGVFWAEIDLNLREPLDWVGHWRSIGPRHRMPHTYGSLLESQWQQ